MTRLILFAAVFEIVSPAAFAADIPVKPGDGTLSAATKNAKGGDVLRLAQGEYREQAIVKLPGHVTLAGAGAGSSVLIGEDAVVVAVAGPECRISGIEFRTGRKTLRGIDSEHPVRVECCRFNRCKEAVNLRGAPLSDVICCEFIECGIGVRACVRASPTIWGCLFKGGDLGAACLHGGPYIRNNLFIEQKTGLMLMTDQPTVVRNNVFWKCKDEGIRLQEIKNAFPLGGPSIRNNIFESCKAAVIGEKSVSGAISHALVHGIKAPPFRNSKRESTINDKAAHIVAADPQLKMDRDGTVICGDRTLLDGKGLRLWNEPPGTPGDIGLTADSRRPGQCPAKADDMPPVRFGRKMLIANSVGEEHDYVRYLNMKIGKQALMTKDGKRYDRVSATQGTNTTEFEFDIMRFMGEAMMRE